MHQEHPMLDIFMLALGLGFFAAALINFARETRIALQELDYH